MGMFDYFETEFNIDQERSIIFGLTFQTKDTPAQELHYYILKTDGFLWLQEMDYSKNPPQQSKITRVDDFTGMMEIYTFIDEYRTQYSYHLWFENGQIVAYERSK